MANSAPGPPEEAAALAPEEGEERALAGARGAPALATGEGEERALAGASGALALAPGEGGEFVLTGRDTAPLPQAVQGGGQEDGWQAILGLGAERSFFVVHSSSRRCLTSTCLPMPGGMLRYYAGGTMPPQRRRGRWHCYGWASCHSASKGHHPAVARRAGHM